MTSKRSNLSAWLEAMIGPALFLGLMYMDDAPPLMIAGMGAFCVFSIYRDIRRRSTLRQRDDGVYVWIEWHGGERSATSDPTEDWDSEGDGDGGD